MNIKTVKESRQYRYAKSVKEKARSDGLAELSGNIAYKIIVSAVPFAIVAAVIFSSMPEVENMLLDVIEPVIADQVWTFVKYILQLAHDNSTVPVISFSMLSMLFIISSAVLSLMKGISVAADGREAFEKRGMLKNRLYTIGVTLIIIVSLAVFGMLSLLTDGKGEGIRYLFAVIALVFVLSIIYKLSPVKNVTFFTAITRALIAAFLILFLTLGMNVYYSFFSQTENIYGTFAGVAITMAWIYGISYCILLTGEADIK